LASPTTVIWSAVALGVDVVLLKGSAGEVIAFEGEELGSKMPEGSMIEPSARTVTVLTDFTEAKACV
jgi:hypothetical protein